MIDQGMAIDTSIVYQRGAPLLLRGGRRLFFHPKEFREMKALVFTAVALALATAAQAEVTFTGYTDGCFAAAACAPPTTSGQAPTSFLGLTYSPSTFNVTTSHGFAAVGADPGLVNNLGWFTLNSDAHAYDGEHFDLRVTFTAPPGTAPGSTVYDTVLVGQVESLDHGGLFVDFDNAPRHFTFTGGSFDLTVNDVSITAGHSTAITGHVVSTVPEPETYALMLAGLVGIGAIVRRRQNGR